MAKKILPRRNDDGHDEAQTAQVLAEGVDIDATASLKKAGVYYIWGEITPNSLKEIHADVLLKHWLGPKRFNSPIQLIISSIGGDADETMSLIDLLANLRFNVATAGFGTCASAGSMLLACGTRGLRTVAPNCTVMLHSYSWSSAGHHHELVAHRKAEDDQRERELGFWSKHSNYKSSKDVEKYLLKKEDNYFTAKEAVKHGLVDWVGGVLR